MIKLPLPANKLEQALEMKILALVKEMIDVDMPLQDILNVLERVRYLTTEIKIEVENGVV